MDPVVADLTEEDNGTFPYLHSADSTRIDPDRRRWGTKVRPTERRPRPVSGHWPDKRSRRVSIKKEEEIEKKKIKSSEP